MKETVGSAMAKITTAREMIFPRDQWIPTPTGERYAANYGWVEYASDDEAVDTLSKFKAGDIISRKFMLNDGREVCLGGKLIATKEYSPFGGLLTRFHNQDYAELTKEELSDYSERIGEIRILPNRYTKWFKVTP